MSDSANHQEHEHDHPHEPEGAHTYSHKSDHPYDHSHEHGHDHDHSHAGPHAHSHGTGLRGWVNTIFHFHGHSDMQQESVQSPTLGPQEAIEAKPALVVEAPSNGPIMVVAAHPDDIESWCAGTLALSIARGALVKLLLITSGDKGSNEPTATTQTVAARREVEARAAAQHLGITEIVFLRLPDGEVEDTKAFRKMLVTWIRRWQPAVLFTHDPEHPYPPYLAHRDHRITGRVALDAVYPLARDQLSFEELASDGLLPHKVAQVWLFSTTTPNAFVEITESFDRKLEARLAHQSQTSDPEALKSAWRHTAATIGKTVGLLLAESFMVLHLT